MKRLGVEADIGILSRGRTDDRKRSKMIEKTLDDAEKTVESLKKKGLKASNCQIRFEDAVTKHNYIIAPGGITGNLMYRSLCLVGGGRGIGAPHVGTDIIYVDTSRAGRGYENAICLASALVSAKQTAIFLEVALEEEAENIIDRFRGMFYEMKFAEWANWYHRIRSGSLDIRQYPVACGGVVYLWSCMRGTVSSINMSIISLANGLDFTVALSRGLRKSMSTIRTICAGLLDKTRTLSLK
jgi:hypothetical protein